MAGGPYWPSAKYLAFIASVVDALHVPISELATLTDRQLIDIYNHPRDKEGRVQVPDEKKDEALPTQAPASLERDLRDLTILAGMFRMPPSKYEELVDKIKTKWAAKKEEPSNG